MNTTLPIITIIPATDDSIRWWLQRQLQAALSAGLDWLRDTLQAAIDERAEIEPLTNEQREAAAEARLQLDYTGGAAWLLRWQRALDHVREARRQIDWITERDLPAARELDRQLEIVEAAAEGAALDPSDIYWNMWRGPQYCQLLLEQPYYQACELDLALEAWERDAPISIEGDHLEMIIDEYEDYL